MAWSYAARPSGYWEWAESDNALASVPAHSGCRLSTGTGAPCRRILNKGHGLSNAFRNCAQRAIRTEEHTSELQSLMRSLYAVFCTKKYEPKQIEDAKGNHDRKGSIITGNCP